jgi:S1-C subfamily serine protease
MSNDDWIPSRETGQPGDRPELPAHQEAPGDWEDFIERAEPTEQPEFHYSAPPDPHPWRRWLARSVDYLFGGVALAMMSPAVPLQMDAYSDAILGILTPILGIVPLALILSATGTSPGQWLFGIGVRDTFGMRPSFKRSLSRETRVVVQGLALGIPGVSLITMVMARRRLYEKDATAWDEHLGLEIRYSGLTWARGIAGAGTLLVFGGLFAIGSSPRLLAPILDSELDPIIDKLEFEVVKAGGEMLGRERISGQLMEGASESFPLLLGRESVTIVATCDGNCIDMDLTLVSPTMDTVALDHAPDAYPYVHYTAFVSGRHELLVDMYGCSFSPCAFAAQVLRYDMEDTGTEGSCFVVSPDGMVATAYHVIEGAERITIGFGDGTVVPAQILSTVDSSDVALLATGLERSSWFGFADRRSIGTGDPVFTLGYPATAILGHEAKFTEGSISSLTGPEGDANLLQTSVPIQPGNSGGPLINDRGEVVGMIVSTAETGSFFGATGSLPQNVNWAVRGDLVSHVIPRLPPSPPRTEDAEVVDRALDSVCWVDVE